METLIAIYRGTCCPSHSSHHTVGVAHRDPSGLRRLSADNELIRAPRERREYHADFPSLAGIALVSTAICLWLNVQAARCARKIAQYDLRSGHAKPMALFGSDQVIDQFPGRRITLAKGRK